jgi:hypothetical protein
VARRALLTRAAVASLLLTATSLAHAAPKSEPWPRWQAHDDSSTVVVDNAAWNALLAAYRTLPTDGIARFRYGAVTSADRARLDSYLATLQATSVSKLRRDEQRAFWINLYNAATVKTVLAHYPIDSILKISISPGWLSRGPWGAKQLKVENEALALDDIEHRILRPLWHDPRTHYSVNCASLGCPNLAAQAWTAASLEAQLDAAASDYVNHPRGARVADGKLRTSSLYAWFRDDFGGSDAGVIAHLKHYAAPPLRAQLEAMTAIDGDDYDWSLNDAK